MTARQLMIRNVTRDTILALPYVLLTLALSMGPLITVLAIYENATMSGVPHTLLMCAIVNCPISGFAMIGMAFMHIRKGCLCPWCSKSMAMFVTLPSLKNRTLSFCPSCGHSLDDQIPLKAKPVKSKFRDDELA